MKEFNLVTCWEAFKGKTIESVYEEDEVYIKFSDGTCAIFEAVESYGCADLEFIDSVDYDCPEHVMVKAGWITEKEYKRAHENRDASRLEHATRCRREQYKKLKKEFGDE